MSRWRSELEGPVTRTFPEVYGERSEHAEVEAPYGATTIYCGAAEPAEQFAVVIAEAKRLEGFRHGDIVPAP